MVLLLSTSPLKWAQFSVLSLPLFSALCFSGDRWTLQHSPASGRKLASSTMIPSCCGRFWRSPFVMGRVVRMMRTDSRRRRRCVCWSTFPAADVAAGDRLWCARLDTIAARWLTVRGHAGTWARGWAGGQGIWSAAASKHHWLFFWWRGRMIRWLRRVDRCLALSYDGFLCVSTGSLWMKVSTFHLGIAGHCVHPCEGTWVGVWVCARARARVYLYVFARASICISVCVCLWVCIQTNVFLKVHIASFQLTG